MSKFDTARPYIAVYVILRREDGKAVFVKRSNTGWMDGKYGLPAGKVEKGETFLQGAVREAKEEVGVDVQATDLRHVLTIHRDSPDDEVDGDMSWVDVFFEATKWAGEPFNAEPHMHSEIAWLDTQSLPDDVIPVMGEMFDFLNQGKTYGEVEWGQR
jgi:mutator protein MutT